jgi:hypothetical protein
MRQSILILPALAAAALLVLTGAHALRLRAAAGPPDPVPKRQRSTAVQPPADIAVSEGRCRIRQAHFGGSRARLVRADKDGVVDFAVIDFLPRGNPMTANYQGDWLMATYGAAETTTLGYFGSARAALVRAAQLCPPPFRCWPGRAGCGEERALSPAELFTGPRG